MFIKNALIGMVFLLSFSGLAYAKDGYGYIEKIKICPTGNGTGRVNYVFFKLDDGNWFGSFGTYRTDQNTSDSVTQSLVFLAASTSRPVTVRANYNVTQACGISANMIWSTKGDYVLVEMN
ncbi:hypothetical protein [Neptuniibacter sp. QD34_54]|uniref:hypothetical protein n=1 Tax=Neptuniibacter sp. QD34_54 TaxID=3398208 RepID=UPI0039F45DFD